MTNKIFTVYDSKAEAYTTPFFSQTTATAIRAFTQAANEVDHDFNRYAADYTLFELGLWDDQTADITTHITLINLGTAITFKKEIPSVHRTIEQA